MSPRLGYPDPDSEFGKKMGLVKYLLRKPLSSLTIPTFMRNLNNKGYDVLAYDIQSSTIKHDIEIARISKDKKLENKISDKINKIENKIEAIINAH